MSTTAAKYGRPNPGKHHRSGANQGTSHTLPSAQASQYQKPQEGLKKKSKRKNVSPQMIQSMSHLPSRKWWVVWMWMKKITCHAKVDRLVA